MIVYLVPPEVPSRAVDRIYAALRQYAPDAVTFTDDEARADFLFLTVIGRRRDVLRRVADGRPYAVLQACLRSTAHPWTDRWTTLWDRAAVVWSYLPLPRWCIEDGTTWPARPIWYHAPLGVEAEDFRPPIQSRPFLVMTTGRGWFTESARECAYAAEGRPVLHLGPSLARPEVLCLDDVPDALLPRLYGACQYVSGLRRVEGFELPAVEGLLCGARPLVYDRPHYRDWYDGLAVFVPETQRVQIIDDLRAVFARPWPAVTPAERAEAVRRFAWRPIVEGLWDRCLARH